MKSKTSFFNVSGAIIREDFKKYWVLPLLIFVGYFLTGLYYIIVNYQNENGLPQFVNMLLQGRYPFYSAIVVAAPLVVSVIVFNYLNTIGSVMSVHAQPFTRSTLLNSHTVASILFCVLPILATGAFLLALAHPTYYAESYYSSPGEMTDLFTRREVLQWMWESILCTLFVLAICLFARMITGTAFHHVVASLGFNVIVALMMFLIYSYLGRYLFGFTGEGFMNGISWTSPVFRLYATEHLKAMSSIVYLLVSLAIYAVTVVLYHRRKLERTTDGVVFGLFHYIITLIFGFLGMTILGMIFTSTFNSRAAGVFGYVIGAVLGILICRMIILKSLKVINRDTFKMAGLFAVVAAVFFGCIAGDLTGYEGRIPQAADSVEISGIGNLLENGYDSYNVTLEGDDVSLAKALHEEILKNKDEYKEVAFIRSAAISYYEEDNDPFEEDPWDYVTLQLRYKKGSTTIESRSYTVKHSLAQSEAAKELLESEGFKTSLEKALPPVQSWHMVDLFASEEYVELAPLTEASEMQGLYTALCADIRERTYEEMIADRLYKAPVLHIAVTYDAKSGEVDEEAGSAVLLSGDEEKRRYASRDIVVYSGDEHTLAWMKEIGYDSELLSNRTEADLAVFYEVKEDSVRTFYKDAVHRGALSREELEGMDGFYRSEQRMEQVQAVYDAMEALQIVGDGVTTEADDVYLVCFLVHDEGSEEYWLSTSGYVHEKDIPSPDTSGAVG